MIRVVLVDDHPLVRRGLRETLNAGGIEVAGETGTPDDVVPLLRRTACDVLLLDLSLPGKTGLDLLADIRTAFPRLPVLVVSTYTEAQYAVRAFRSGAAGYLSKTCGPDELVHAVRTIFTAGRHVTPAAAVALADSTLQRAAEPRHQALSNREHEVLRLLVGGQTVSEIAARLSLSAKTVSTYLTRLRTKLGIHTTAGLIRYAVDEKLFDA